MLYCVTLKPSGKSFGVEVGKSILDAAFKEKINLPYSCRNGNCGACKSRLISGTVDYPERVEGVTVDELEDGYILTCVTSPTSNLEIESTYYPELDGIESKLLPCKVDSIDYPAQGIAILRLRLSPSSNLSYLPGQYIDLMYKGVRRSYSIANAKDREHIIELHIRNVPNGVFSQFVFNELKPGSLLRMEGPYGTFFIRKTDAPIIFLAGGTGFAPVKAMIEQLLAQKSQRRIHIYWGVQEQEHLYSGIPDLWQSEHDNIVFTPVVSEPGVKWKGRQGLVHWVVMEDHSNLAPYEVYSCGSPQMIAAAKKDFTLNGLKIENFFADAFTAFMSTDLG